MTDETSEALWQLADFCLRENYALRSFLRYLLESPDTPEVKRDRLTGWRPEVGTSLGNPLTSSRVESVLNTIRDLPPSEQPQALQGLLENVVFLFRRIVMFFQTVTVPAISTITQWHSAVAPQGVNPPYFPAMELGAQLWEISQRAPKVFLEAWPLML